MCQEKVCLELTYVNPKLHTRSTNSENHGLHSSRHLWLHALLCPRHKWIAWRNPANHLGENHWKHRTSGAGYPKKETDRTFPATRAPYEKLVDSSSDLKKKDFTKQVKTEHNNTFHISFLKINFYFFFKNGVPPKNVSGQNTRKTKNYTLLCVQTNMFNFREFTREEIHELFDSEQQFQRFCVKFELLEGFDICCWNVKDEWTNLFKEKKE